MDFVLLGTKAARIAREPAIPRADHYVTPLITGFGHDNSLEVIPQARRFACGLASGIQNCRKNRRSLAQNWRMSSIAYLSIVMRCGPMPKAKPLNLSGS